MESDLTPLRLRWAVLTVKVIRQVSRHVRNFLTNGGRASIGPITASAQVKLVPQTRRGAQPRRQRQVSLDKSGEHICSNVEAAQG
jgi:hypothetical protein